MNNMIILDGQLTTDHWRTVRDDESLPPDGSLLFGYERFVANALFYSQRPGGLGVILQPEDSLEPILPWLGRLNLIGLHFPRVADGRHYSTARLLRTRHGYQGELRATGEVYRDQLDFMRRVGFNAFQLPESEDPQAVLNGVRGPRAYPDLQYDLLRTA